MDEITLEYGGRLNLSTLRSITRKTSASEREVRKKRMETKTNDYATPLFKDADFSEWSDIQESRLRIVPQLFSAMNCLQYLPFCHYNIISPSRLQTRTPHSSGNSRSMWTSYARYIMGFHPRSGNKFRQIMDQPNDITETWDAKKKTNAIYKDSRTGLVNTADARWSAIWDRPNGQTI